MKNSSWLIERSNSERGELVTGVEEGEGRAGTRERELCVCACQRKRRGRGGKTGEEKGRGGGNRNALLFATRARLFYPSDGVNDDVCTSSTDYACSTPAEKEIMRVNNNNKRNEGRKGAC